MTTLQLIVTTLKTRRHVCPKSKMVQTGVYVNLPKTGTSEVLFVPGYNRWGGGGGDPPHTQKRDAWKELRNK
jgi:hypothetical protein